jgi:hypothetical protein
MRSNSRAGLLTQPIDCHTVATVQLLFVEAAMGFPDRMPEDWASELGELVDHLDAA